jgi:hypothetical protein
MKEKNIFFATEFELTWNDKTRKKLVVNFINNLPARFLYESVFVLSPKPKRNPRKAVQSIFVQKRRA